MKLTNLKNRLNRSALKEVTFSNEMKSNVLTSIRQMEEQNYTHKPILQYFNFALSSLVVTSFLIGTVWFTTGKLGLFDSKQPDRRASISDEKVNSQTEDKIDSAGKKRLKIDIQNKLQHSIDYFKTAEGSFTIFRTNQDIDEKEISYHVDLDKKTKFKVTMTNTVTQDVVETITNGNNIYHIYKNKKEYIKKILQSRNHNNSMPPLGEAKESLFPEHLVSKYLNNFSYWSIEAEEKYLDRKVVVIEGDFNQKVLLDKKAVTFRGWVDKQTGILLRYETYDQNFNVVDYLKTKSIKIDGNMPDTKFNFNLNGLKKVDSFEIEEDTRSPLR